MAYELLLKSSSECGEARGRLATGELAAHVYGLVMWYDESAAQRPLATLDELTCECA